MVNDTGRLSATMWVFTDYLCCYFGVVSVCVITGQAILDDTVQRFAYLVQRGSRMRGADVTVGRLQPSHDDTSDQ